MAIKRPAECKWLSTNSKVLIRFIVIFESISVVNMQSWDTFLCLVSQLKHKYMPVIVFPLYFQWLTHDLLWWIPAEEQRRAASGFLKTDRHPAGSSGGHFVDNLFNTFIVPDSRSGFA